jgi:hypothetical protein
MGICAAKSGTVYVTTLYPFTVHALKIPRVAGVTTVYHHNSHSDVLLSRLMQTDTLNFTGDTPPLNLASLYIDQIPPNDLSEKLAKEYEIPIYQSIPESLTQGTDKLTVDGVLLIAEHGRYPESETGQIQYPKRQMFGEIVQTFKDAGKIVPVFSDKHLADNWADAKWIYDTARDMQIPLMAGSSLPVLWRYPAIDVTRDARLKEIVAISYHRLDTYGFHALEMVQCLVERRQGGETGVKSVECRVGPAVWEAEKEGVYDRKLLDAALRTVPPWLIANAVPGTPICSADSSTNRRNSSIRSGVNSFGVRSARYSWPRSAGDRLPTTMPTAACLLSSVPMFPRSSTTVHWSPERNASANTANSSWGGISY